MTTQELRVDPSVCPSFVECRAPLCPLDESLYKGAVWYADEDICGAREFRNLAWIRKQRKLKKARRRGFFTFDMLEVLGSRTANGVDPDSRQTVWAWIRERVRQRG